MKLAAMLALLACFVSAATAEPFLPGTGFLPTGNLRTTDRDGPYNLTFLGLQVADVEGGIAARDNFTDKDMIDFLVNVECLEGQFDTWGTFGFGFIGNLSLGGPTPLGARQAALTGRTKPYMEEVALNEQAHALLTRHLGSSLPCPLVDFDGGFNKFMAAAFGLNGTVQGHFGAPFDPFKNDVNFILSVLTLEELGATGNKGLSALVVNPAHADAISGLATSATAQATVQRFLLWQMRDETVEPFGESAQQVFARVSALRDSLDGPQFDDQGIVNTDARFIAVPDHFINLIPTGIHGVTFNRSPQQIINILTLGNPEGKGCFFPNGLGGKLNKPTGFNQSGNGLTDFPTDPVGQVATQEPTAALGKLGGAITAAGPFTAPGELDLTQALGGQLENASADTRGLAPVPDMGTPNQQGPQVQVAT